MRLRRSSNFSHLRHPALAAVALVALAPMLPLAVTGDDLTDDQDESFEDDPSPVLADESIDECEVPAEGPANDEVQHPVPMGPTSECDDEQLDETTESDVPTVDESVDVPTVDESGGAPEGQRPGTPEPGTPEPGTPEPGTPEPGTPEVAKAGKTAERIASPTDPPETTAANGDATGADGTGDNDPTTADVTAADDAGGGESATSDLADPSGTPDSGDAGLRAERYDGVYAQGVPVWVAMTATRFLESRGNYAAQARGSTASGAYQVIDSTWNGYGGYRRSVDAPASIQDQFAYESMVAILKRYGNDVSAIPLAWYYPAALRNPDLMDVVPVPAAGNILTPRQYQARWMAIFHQHLEAGSPVFLPADTDALIPAIAFPVLGPTTFWDDWHADRDGGARRHEGLDFMGENGQPLRAAFDGVVTRIRPTNVGRPGVGITLTRADGLRANYFHLDAVLKWHPDLEVGDTVKAGQIIAFLGDTGNAGIPHLHFELRTEDGEPMAPYPAVLEAIQREQCSVGIGPWSTEFKSPAEIAAELVAAAETADLDAVGADSVDVDGVDVDGVDVDGVDVDEPTVHHVSGPDGARWTVSSDGGVTAWGPGALVAPGQGACDQIPEMEFGTGAAGLGIELLGDDWWGDEVDPEDLAAMIAAVEAERSHEFDRYARDPTSSVLRIRIGRGGILSAMSAPDLRSLGFGQLAE
jgi:hypothetical protein